MVSWILKNFFEGLSENKFLGTQYSSANMISADVFSEIPFLTCSQALKKISGTTVTDLIIRFVSVGNKVFAFGNSGKVYLIDGTTVTLLYNTGEAILDAAYFWGDLYWTTATKLGKCYPYTTSGEWTTNAIPQFADPALTSQDYHPLYAIGDRLFIGDGRWIDMVAISTGTPTYNSHSLDIQADWKVRALTLLKPLLLIGVECNGAGKLITWDFINADDSYEPLPGLEEGVCDGFINVNGIIYATIGKSIYWFNGIIPVQVRELDSSVRLGARTIYNGSPYFATSKIYTWKRKNKNFPYTLFSPFKTSVSADVIGALQGTADNLYVGWKSGSSYGIDCIDNSNKATTTVESRLLEGDDKIVVGPIKYYFDALSANTSIQLKYRLNDTGSFKPFKNSSGNIISNITGATCTMIPFNEVARSIELQIILTPSGNTAPVLKRVLTKVALKEQAF